MNVRFHSRNLLTPNLSSTPGEIEETLVIRSVRPHLKSVFAADVGKLTSPLREQVRVLSRRLFPFRFRRILLLVWMATAACAHAHIGSPNVFFEGQAGPYPVRVVIRPPGIVPGLAEISVRVFDGRVERVAALPVYWDAGREGAPPPDEARLVRGETNLYTTELWLMSPGSYSVDVIVEGPAGKGTIVVPVNSVATTRNSMPGWFAGMLCALGVLLFLGAVKLVGAACGESVLPPGEELRGKARWRSRVAMVGGCVFFAALVAGGKAWWDHEDRDYRSNRLYKPVAASASVRLEQGQPILRLAVEGDGPRHWRPLIPDHGKLMHLFLIREPELDALAHLHPVQVRDRVFEVGLPPLPAGNYQVYADVTHEDGFSQTLTASAQLPSVGNPSFRLPSTDGRPEVVCSSGSVLNTRTNPLAYDPDDSWHIGPAAGSSPAEGTPGSALANGFTMRWETPDGLAAQRETTLRFQLIDPDGRSAPLQPYMGMMGHAVIRRQDGAVFSHLHPVGTFSMASQAFFVRKDGDSTIDASQIPAEPASRGNGANGAVSFPYEFPQPGVYRLWVQVRSGGKLLTGVFDAEVKPPE